MTTADQLAEDLEPNTSARDHDESAEFQEPNEFIENLQKDLTKWMQGFRHFKRLFDRDQSKLTPIEKSLNELQVALRHLEQNIEIPELCLQINPHIQQIVDAAKSQNRKPKPEDLGTLGQDPEFLASLSNGVVEWIKAIQKVTNMDRDPSSGTALQEATFWINLEKALNKITTLHDSIEVITTLDVLKAGKRFHVTTSFESDTGLKEKLTTAIDYNVLMKDLPLSELLGASDLDSLRQAVLNIFNVFKKLRNTKYPVKRAMQFFNTISADLCEQMIQILKPRLLMHAPISELDEVMAVCSKIWFQWDEESDKIQGMFRDIAKRQRSDVKFQHRTQYRHKDLENRLNELNTFRRQHEQLSNVISRVLRFKGANSLGNITGKQTNPEKEVIKAYEAIKEVNYLDLSHSGQQAWQSSMQYYKNHIVGIETQLASHLRDQLGSCKSADDMFSIFSRYNALFVRPHIQTAIREYQAVLIDRVREDIRILQETIIDPKKMELAIFVVEGYDIPEFSAKVMWLRQNELQLNMNMQRIADVLGTQWVNHLEGKELKRECDLLKKQLDTSVMFKEWSDRVLTKCKTTNDKLFCVEKQQRDGKVICRLRVNYSADSIRIAKEVRNLKNMGFRIPFKIMSYSVGISQYNPYAISLMESVRLYESTNEIILTRPSVENLVAGHRLIIHDLLCEGYKTDWSNFKLESYVCKFGEAVNNFLEKVTDLIEYLDKIDVELSALDKCQYNEETISQIIGAIQKSIDQMALNDYSNLHKWIEELDKTLEAKLARRLEEAIHVWTLVLQQNRDELEDEREANILPKINTITLEIRIVSQFITVVPSLEKAKSDLFDQFYHWHSIITAQPRISSSRFQQQRLFEAYKAIDDVLLKTNDYVNHWTRYQALWDLQQDILFERLGFELTNWMKVILEIKKSRSMVDSPESQHKIFPFSVDYSRVQSKIAMKYDYWQKEVLSKFGNFLGTSMHDFFSYISTARSELESQSIDSTNTSDTVALITQVQNLKKHIIPFKEKVSSYCTGQKLLNNHRFTFPPSWLYAENVEGEWSALMDVLERKDTAIQTQITNLQTRIHEEDKLLEKHINDLISEWNKSRPVKGAIRPKDALAILTNFEDKFKRLKDEQENIVKAKNALEISESVVSINQQSASKLELAIEELEDLSCVWKSLLPIYNNLDELKEIPWLSIQPRKLRQNLEEQLGKLRNLPSHYKQYDAYAHVKGLLQNYLKMNLLIMELKSEALKDRHWRTLMKEMGVNWVLSELTLGKVWSVDLQRHEHAVREVLLTAQGELALEEFIRQVKDYWTDYTLDLVGYQQKTRLIRGWDDLFNKLKEHMNSLNQMKLSSYYKQFEEDALSWEDKLNRINALFDVWIDVQRRWVYLEGLFTGSADIAHLLPSETSRFNQVSTEFLGLMRKVSQSPRILEVVHIQGAQKILERLADLLSKIQKALGEYLERERNSFPRFYFVGDEDLLEILGNSKDLLRVQKHFKKMFSGIVAVEHDTEKNLIKAISSREGETVLLTTPIDLIKNFKINDWLRLMEREMQATLAEMLSISLNKFFLYDVQKIKMEEYINWIEEYPSQIVNLAMDVWWTNAIEMCLKNGENLSKVAGLVEKLLSLLSNSVLCDQPRITRLKIINLITAFIHKKGIIRDLLKNEVKTINDYNWLKNLRVYFEANTKKCVIKMSNAVFYYGFEYLGIQEKLVQTPLTDRCYLTMTQALHFRFGGSPFGPAGTGKTESVKALGHQLGCFVLVFNCDETFDFQAVGRILVGLCQVGAWGCFDEFNRLEERMLSAVSQQIQAIQETIRNGGNMKVDLIGKNLTVNENMAIFITMNPGYSGRSNLPDNLKQLFRSFAMTAPDSGLIAEVMLSSQGFQSAEILSNKIVLLFTLCKEQLSSQCHYDFGLRALKNVLVSAGNIKREAIQNTNESNMEADASSLQISEQQILIQSVCETLTPKLVSEDITLLQSLLHDVFPEVDYQQKSMETLRDEIIRIATEEHYCCSTDIGEKGSLWMEKVLQVYQITNLNHGLMLVGSSGSGKSSAWKILLKSLEKLENVEGVSHVIDAKAMSKDALYGVLDPNTREWTDGLFTHIIRKIVDNVRGEASRRQWIIFDGDVDPEWVENLNSVLDDNKLLTLPNGERLAIPPNVRIIFEVADLKYATMATVSRCGMVWFSEDVVTSDMLFERYHLQLRNIPLFTENPSNSLKLQEICADLLFDHMKGGGLIPLALNFTIEQLDHIMYPSKQRLLMSFFSMMNFSIKQLLQYDADHPDFPPTTEQVENFIGRSMLINLIWSFSGDGNWKSRKALSDFVRSSTTIQLPQNESLPLIDFYVPPTGDWTPWSDKVPQIEIQSDKIVDTSTVIPTMDTVRHESLLNTWLNERKPLVLCGPPGSGKTMTLLSALRSFPDMDVINVNFSSSTTPELLLKNFDHYCEYRRTPNGVVLSPIQITRWLVIFCDEINLPQLDKYGTQRVISFMRQLVEQNGFYRTSDKSWVSLERIQFVGACNPPTDPGRNPLSSRFLRHVPVIYVDYPGETSLIQIYGTFARAMLRPITQLHGKDVPLTDAIVEFYQRSQEHFTQDDQPHYVYSPRELTRWVRGINEAIAPMDGITTNDLVRLWAHEALRLFQDRLVYDEERKWTEDLVDEIAGKYFAGSCDLREALERPILYSSWLKKKYSPVSQKELADHVVHRLKQYNEEEIDVGIVLYDQMLDHLLRIDRVFRQPQGHLLLIGVSGSGKTTLSRFVAWMNGYSVVQLKVHSKYKGSDFDEDVRLVLRRAGCKGEKICFIMDESNMLETGFLERLNTLLANGEVPGLFEGDDYNTLLNQIKEGAQRQGQMPDSPEELYKWFTQQIVQNLHIVFTMNPSGDGLRARASTSPALFNRCVLNWFGDWSNASLYQVGDQLTSMFEIDKSDYVPPAAMEHCCDRLPTEIYYRDAVVNSFVHIHNEVQRTNDVESRKGHRVMAVTPRHYLDFIKHFTTLFKRKREELTEEKIHLENGLKKIQETEKEVTELKSSLSQKSEELRTKQKQANEKLQQMLADQREAENEKKKSETLQEQIRNEKKMIEIKKAEVEKELADVLPAVEEAKSAVSGIKKQQLVEVRSMASPPKAVQLAVEAICLLLGEKVSSWRDIRGILVKEDFIPRIVQFNTEAITPEITEKMKPFVNNPDWEYEKVLRASQACGPLVKWSKAQLSYAKMLNKVEPLNNELSRLQQDASQKAHAGGEVKKKIEELEERIQKLKDEYAQLIAEAENIKQNLAAVQKKVDRSTQLLSSLRVECDRWQASREGFSQQNATLVGDVLLSAAFLSYSGYYDQYLRDKLFHKWMNILQTADVVFRHELARIEYLSTADERQQWYTNGMPKDELCTENAIMLHNFNRFPLIIDPNGQSIDYICKEFSSNNRDQKITVQKTSFNDNSFRKTLESALRFGTTLLVQDVESYDPILNPVLNREVKKASGRVLITIGDQDIDLSPAFKIFLFTRDSSVEFPSDVCSRVTFVNFTITKTSLELQCLNQVLHSERPDIEEKRNNLLKLQGEFAVKLRQLEKALLNALNDSKGKILDDDSVIATLEKLKNEAKEVQKKSSETDEVIKEVDRVSQEYNKLATACSYIYMMLHQLEEIHLLYNYSLDFLLDIFTNALKSPRLSGVKDHHTRLSIILQDLFSLTYSRVSHGMMHIDKILLALLLLRIYLRCTSSNKFEEEFDYLLLYSSKLQLKSATNQNLKQIVIPPLNEQQIASLISLSRLPAFKECIDKFKTSVTTDDLTEWLRSDQPENSVPEIWTTKELGNPITKALNEFIVIYTLRPDRLLASAHLLICATFGNEFMLQDKVLNLREVIENEIKSKVPVLLCSAVGYDVSGRVEDLAVEMNNKDMISIAIGSSEGFDQADKALDSSSRNGRWMLLKNVHLATDWLTHLEKKLHNLKPHNNFRLFLTAEINSKLPVSMIQASRVLVFEPSTGLKANLLRSISSISPQKIAKNPAERSRLYFLLCWFHAIVQERLRYQPLGWANSYEFSDADLRVACDTLDQSVDEIAQGRSNVKPSKLPWLALRSLLSQCIYGGKIDNRFDQNLLETFLNKLFTQCLFDSNFVLIEDIDGNSTPLVVPDETSTKDSLINWVHQIKAAQMPSWIGLPNNAEKVLLTERGQELLRKMLKMSDDELAYDEIDSSLQNKVAPSWMVVLKEHCQAWLAEFPKEICKLRRTKENVKDPIFRFFEREINLGSRLLNEIRKDLIELLEICDGKHKQNNHTRELIAALVKSKQVPQSWKQYTTPRDVIAHEWMNDLKERVKQLDRLSRSNNLKAESIWLGGMFFPEAYITATRQFVAQTNGWSLEQLNMHVRSVGKGVDQQKQQQGPTSFSLTGLRAVGINCESPNKIKLTDCIHSEVDKLQFVWTLEKQKEKEVVSVPVYLYSNRAQFLFELYFVPVNFDKALLSQRGVALLTNSSF
ncbi:unnamed protein product [Meloidogyne enterolobii]|uniref:Uncharacterized protein n=1 Tax=Meloidogyne enterolobii TaxID=390850 RepID=A0ACB1A040_MELEN